MADLKTAIAPSPSSLSRQQVRDDNRLFFSSVEMCCFIYFPSCFHHMVRSRCFLPNTLSSSGWVSVQYHIIIHLGGSVSSRAILSLHIRPHLATSIGRRQRQLFSWINVFSFFNSAVQSCLCFAHVITGSQGSMIWAVWLSRWSAGLSTVALLLACCTVGKYELVIGDAGLAS